MFNNKSILITGGTGSFGNAFVNYIMLKYNQEYLNRWEKIYEDIPQEESKKIAQMNLGKCYFDIEGTHLRPPDFNVEDKYLTDTSRATQYETWEELLGGDPKYSSCIG